MNVNLSVDKNSLEQVASNPFRLEHYQGKLQSTPTPEMEFFIKLKTTIPFEEMNNQLLFFKFNVFSV